MFKLIITTTILLSFSLICSGQINQQSNRQITITKITADVKIDGVEDSIWIQAELANGFINHRPTDEGLAQSQTEVKMLYNDQFVFIMAKAYHGNNPHIIQNLKRDNFWSNDGFGVVLDPINTQTNGFFFGVNSRGSQAEALVESTGNTDWNWDAKWYSRVGQYADYWLVEMAIPFYTLRYDAENKTWGINFVRNDLGNNMYSTWTSFPTNFDELDLGYTGQLLWSEQIPKIEKRLAIIPSLTGTVGEDFEQESGTDWRLTPSLDAKYMITSSMYLDLTINPDFSQIEVDRQVTNLSRFSLFFPERRTFFLENSDLFTSFGRSRVRPFFSRRIGLRNGENIPILFGARLTGNLTEKTRLGIMNVQTGDKGELDAQNYGVLAVQQRVLKRSTIGGIFVNRQNTSESQDYNRVAGTEFTYSSQNGNISADAMLYKSFSENLNQGNTFASGSFGLNERAYRLYMTAEHIGENYLTDVGFTPRLFNYDAVRDTTVRIEYQRYSSFGALDFRPTNGSIVFHGPRISATHYTHNGNQFNERQIYLGYEIDFANQSQFDAGVTNYRINLLFPTSFIDNDNPLPAGIYNYTDLFLDWDSDPRKLFGYGTVFTTGSFFSARRVGLRSYIQYRVQPWLRVRLNHNFNHIDFGERGKEDLHLLGLRTEVSFSTTIFLTAFFQYNTQSSNFNINTRFQWRFAPMSDLFIVYTDNYITEPFIVKNRYLSLKMNYWLNL